jgi:hypothetical protein
MTILSKIIWAWVICSAVNFLIQRLYMKDVETFVDALLEEFDDEEYKDFIRNIFNKRLSHLAINFLLGPIPVLFAINELIDHMLGPPEEK